MRFLQIGCLCVALGLPVQAMAGSINDFVLYGVNRVQMGHSSKVLSGNVGSEVEVKMASGTHVAGDVHSGGTFAHKFGKIDKGVGGSIYANGDVKVGVGMGVGGSIHSSGNVVLRKNSTVGGNVVHVAGKSVTLGSNATVAGSITQGVPIAPMLPGLPSPVVFAAGTDSVIVSNGPTLTSLTPGFYDAVDLGTGNVLELSAGDYYMSSFNIGSGGTVNVDASGGQVNVYVIGDWKTGSGVEVKVDNGDPSNFFVQVGGDFRMAGGAKFEGTVLAHNGLIKVGSGSSKSSLTGAFWAQEIDLEHNVMVNHNPVPEPGSMVLFGAGLLIVGYCTRRKKESA